MVIVFGRWVVIFVWFLTCYSSVRHVLPTFWRCHKVSHPDLHHPPQPPWCVGIGRLGKRPPLLLVSLPRVWQRQMLSQTFPAFLAWLVLQVCHWWFPPALIFLLTAKGGGGVTMWMNWRTTWTTTTILMVPQNLPCCFHLLTQIMPDLCHQETMKWVGIRFSLIWRTIWKMDWHKISNSNCMSVELCIFAKAATWIPWKREVGEGVFFQVHGYSWWDLG